MVVKSVVNGVGDRMPNFLLFRSEWAKPESSLLYLRDKAIPFFLLDLNLKKSLFYFFNAAATVCRARQKAS